VDHYPAEDSKLRASSILRRRGGNCPNTLEILQQLVNANHGASPVKLALLSVLPSRSSPAYQEIKSSFDTSTDLSHCICRDDVSEPASSYIIRSREADSRTIINYNGLPEMTVEEFISVVSEMGEGLGWCHFEGRIPDTTGQCIQHLRQYFPHVKISVEVEKPGKEGLQELASLADVIFYSKSWAQSRKGAGYTSAGECLRAQAALVPKASLLLCTWEAAGVSALEMSNMTDQECPAFKPEGTKVTDTVGAGDTFIAGMLFALTSREEWSLDRKLHFANELAGRKVVQEGFRGLGGLMEHAL
ncbi:MAG: hypothetical protein Q9169_004555, partial [Polycauliona sp. 2 TL-2023]